MLFKVSKRFEFLHDTPFYYVEIGLGPFKIVSSIALCDQFWGKL